MSDPVRYLVVKNGIVVNAIVGHVPLPGVTLVEQTLDLKNVGIGWYQHSDGSFAKTPEAEA